MGPSGRFVLLFLLGVGGTLLLAWPLGLYLARTLEGERHWGHRLERLVYRACRIDPTVDMRWLDYARALLAFNFCGTLLAYGLQRLQAWLPFNPQGFAAPGGDSAFNTAISFVANTDWQSYAGESTLSYLTQSAALAVQQFLSAATGIAVAFALMRGFRRTASHAIGNFWTDVTRATLYVLLPLASLLAVLLVGQGVIQNLDGYREAHTLEAVAYDAPLTDESGNPRQSADGKPLTAPATSDTQMLAMGPVASFEAIKQLGTNGGGFFNANSAHPYENPTPLSNLLEIMAILLIPFALTVSFGKLVGDARQGRLLAGVMLVLLAGGSFAEYAAEARGTPALAAAGMHGNLEGKEVRFGLPGSALFVAATTATSTGAVNASHDSLTPLGGLVPLVFMQLGEVAPGGVGSGLYSMIIFAILAVFIAGLMIGRTPEYLGKKIEARDMKLATVFILTTPILVLAGAALAVIVGAGAVANPGAHGFSEILYAFTSAANNNGSAFGGLSANTPFYNIALGAAMWLGRFWPIVATLALAGSLAAKSRTPQTEGTMPTHGWLFAVLLIGTILLVGVLNYVPALALGPLAEEFMS